MPSPEYLVRTLGEGSGKAEAGTRPAAAEPTVTASDVAVDRSVDKQIETDRRASDEPDLLSEAPTDRAAK
jgi:hypothetical protein